MKSVLRCAACRAFVQGDDRFCWSCGSELDRVEAAGRTHSAALEEPSELDPELAVVLRRAYLAQQRGQLDEAERLVREVLARQPEAVPALSMLAGILRAKGDLVGSVAAAQQVSEVAASRKVPSGAVEHARGERAKIEEQIVRQMRSPYFASNTPFAVLRKGGAEWYRSRQMYLSLTAMGVVALLLALVAAAHGELSGFAWFSASLLSAGWCHGDAQTRRQGGLLWAPFVFCLGPFGLAIYLLAIH
jgi:hypothetical protein